MTGVQYGSTKTYCHNVGLSAAFRQWRAESHCRFIHGYALQVHVEFEATKLDDKNWVVDFGSLKPFKAWLEDTFDHKLLVATDDPYRYQFNSLNALGIAVVRYVPATGCEAFAKLIFDWLEAWLKHHNGDRVRVKKVEVSEHDTNSAYVIRKD